MRKLAKQLTGIVGIDPSSITCSSSKSLVKGKALKEMCFQAWHELFGIDPPSDEERAEREEALQKARQAKAAATRAKKKELLELLVGDKGSVRAWNERAAEAKNVGPFNKVDQSGRDLAGIQLADMPEGEFAGCDLTGARLRRLNLSKAS